MKFHFGPNLYYYFDDGNGTFKYRAPQTFNKFFHQERITGVLHIAFGVEDSWFCFYTTAFGQEKYHLEHNGHYSALNSWLSDNSLHHRGLYVSLGADEAFFARTSEGQKWRNIPEDALDYYQKFTRPDLFRTSRVDAIDIGFKGSFLGTCINGDWFWDLNNQYPRFESMDLKRNILNVTSAYINPFARDQHFAVFKNGTIHYSLPPEWINDIAQLFQQYAQRTVQSTQARSSWGRSTSAQSVPTMQSAQQNSSWRRASSASAGPSPTGQAFHTAHNFYDIYSNLNSGGTSGSGNVPDFSQATDWIQNSVNTMNQASNYGNQGMNFMSSLSSNGLLVGQMMGQMAPVMAACNVM